MKKFLTLIVLVIVMITSSNVNAQPLKVIALPVIITPQAKLNTSTRELMEAKIVRALFVPKTDKLPGVEYISSNQSKEALKKILHELDGESKKTKLLNAMEPLAKYFNADFVVSTVVFHSNQQVNGTKLNADAAVNMIVFDNRTGALMDRVARRNYQDDYISYGTSDSLAMDCLTTLINEIKIKERLLQKIN